MPGGRWRSPFFPPLSLNDMAQFIAAVHATDATPRALALLEAQTGASGLSYVVRDVRTLDGDPVAAINSFLASEPQYVGQTTLVTTGGQAAADALHAAGPSAAAVTLVSDSTRPDQDALDVSAQVLVDTFEMLFRAGAVEAPAPTDAVANAIHTLYQGADLDNAAPEGDRNADGDLDDADGPGAVRVEQSGSASPTLTQTIKAPIGAREASAAAVDAGERLGRVAAHTGEPVSLGEHESVALALALGVWYGEITADDLPMTDQADEVLDKRDRRNAARNR